MVLTRPSHPSRSFTGHSRTEVTKQKEAGSEHVARGYHAKSSTGAACRNERERCGKLFTSGAGDRMSCGLAAGQPMRSLCDLQSTHKSRYRKLASSHWASAVEPSGHLDKQPSDLHIAPHTTDRGRSTIWLAARSSLRRPPRGPRWYVHCAEPSRHRKPEAPIHTRPRWMRQPCCYSRSNQVTRDRQASLSPVVS